MHAAPTSSSPGRPSLLQRLGKAWRSLALVPALAAGLAAADSVTVTVDSTGALASNAALVTSSGTVTYIVTYSEDVFPTYFKTARASTLTPGIPAIFPAFTTGGTVASPVINYQQVDGNTYKVIISGLADGETASLTVGAGFSKSSDASAMSATAAIKTVKFLDPAEASKWSPGVTTTANYGFLSNPILTGTYTVTGLGASSVDDYVVSVALDGSASGVTSTTNATWTYQPTAPPAIGAHTFTITAKDAAGTTGTQGGGTPSVQTVDVFVWSQPTVAQVKKASSGAYGAFANSMSVSSTKPEFKGLVGLPLTMSAGSGRPAGGAPTVTVNIYSPSGSTNPVMPAMTAHITAGASASVDSAEWELQTADYTAALANGTYDIELTMAASSSGGAASANNIKTTKTFTVNNAASPATGPTLSTASIAANHFPILTITGTAPSNGTTTAAGGSPAGTSNVIMYMSSDDGSTWDTIAGTVSGASGATASWTPTSCLVDDAYKFKATETDAAGNVSSVGAILDHTVTTPAPTIAVTSTSANHFPTITINRNSADAATTIKVYNGTTVIGNLIAGTVTAGTWTPDAQLPDGVYNFRATQTETVTNGSNLSADSNLVTFTITTPTPVLATHTPEGSATAVKPTLADAGDANYQYLGSTRRPVIGVTGLSANGSLAVYARSRGTSTPLAVYTAAQVISGGSLVAGAYNNGTHTWTPTSAMAEDSYTLAAVWTDNDASNGTDSATHATVDSVNSNVLNIRVLGSVLPPAIAGVYPVPKAGSNLLSGNTVVVSYNQVTLTGTGNAGATLNLFVKAGSATSYTSLPTIVVGNDSTWTYVFKTGTGDANDLLAGNNLLLASQDDLSGSSSALTTQPITVQVSSLVPAAPIIQAPLTGATMALTTPTFTGTAPATDTVKLYEQVGGSPDLNADTLLATSAVVPSNGLWSATVGSALSVGSHIIYAVSVSPASLVSTTSNVVAISVVAPTLFVRLEPIAAGTGTGYLVNGTTFTAGKTVVAVDTGTGTILKGDQISFAGDPNKYVVAIGTNAAGSITLTTPLKTTLANNAAVTITDPNPSGPLATTVSDPPSSLATVQLTATMKQTNDAGAGVPSVLSTDFVKSKIQITNGTVASVVKGTNAADGQASNVFTVTVNPATTGLMEVWIPAGGFKSSPGQSIASIAVGSAGADYCAAPTVKITGAGNEAAAHATMSGGTVAGVVVDNGGWGFSATPSISFLPPPGTGATATATFSGGAVTGFTVTNGGTGYTTAPTVTFSTGKGGAATAVIGAGGSITGITKTAGGQYYSQPPTVTIGGVGSGATATCTVSNGAIGTFTITAAGSGYVAGSTTVTLTPTGTPATAHANLGTGATATKVASITVDTGGTYTAAPYVILTTGSGATATATMSTGTAGFNAASVSTQPGGGGDTAKYSLNVNRLNPTVTWQWAAANTAALRPTLGSAGTAITGTSYVALDATPATTSFKVRAHFSSKMNRALLASDLTTTGCTALVNGDITDIGGNHQDFDILMTRGVATGTAMSVTVKAVAGFADISVPALANKASAAFVATVVKQPQAPIIASSVGAAAPAKGAKTASYPCTVTFIAPVTGFTAKNLTVTNGVITNFAGSAALYSFTLTPGEGLVKVKYDPAVAGTAIYDVAGNSIPASNELTRLCDSTQPKIVTVTSPFFKQMGTGAAGTAVLTADAVTSITVTNAGSGYAVAPVVRLGAPPSGGTQATATAVIDAVAGTITGFTITNGGSGYLSAPTVTIYNSMKPQNGSGRFPMIATFSESLTAFPTTALISSVSGATLTIAAPTGSPVGAVGPQIVSGSGGTQYAFDVVVPTTTPTDGAHTVRMVVPSQGVGDGATNPGQASKVYTFDYDLTNGAPINSGVGATYGDG